MKNKYLRLSNKEFDFAEKQIAKEPKYELTITISPHYKLTKKEIYMIAKKFAGNDPKGLEELQRKLLFSSKGSTNCMIETSCVNFSFDKK